MRWWIPLVLAVSVTGAACKQPPDPEQQLVEAHAVSSDVLVRVDAPGLALSEIEQRVAVPLEQMLVGLAKVEGIDTRIHSGHLELVLRVAAGEDARPIALEVAMRSSAAAKLLASSASRPVVALEPRSGGVMRFESMSERPQPIDMPGVQRMPICGPERGREVVIDPAKLVQANVAIDDVLAAVDGRPVQLADALLPGGHRLGDVASIGEADRSDCHVVSGATHLASLHHTSWSVEMYEALSRAGWRPTKLLGGQVEVLIGFDGAGTELVARVARNLQGQPGIDGAIAMEERGPPHVGRIIFHPSWDAKVREAVRASVAAVPGVHVIELIEASGQRAEAVVTGPDRRALIERTRTALLELGKVDPEGGAGCLGCDLVAQLELQLAESASPLAPRLPGLLRREGIEVSSSGGSPLRVRIDQGIELSPQVVAEVPVRTSAGTPAPLSSVAALAITERPAMLLRHDGQAAVIVWKRPWKATIYGAKETLQKAFPGAPVREAYSALW